jgi:hypothetical protein
MFVVVSEWFFTGLSDGDAFDENIDTNNNNNTEEEEEEQIRQAIEISLK